MAKRFESKLTERDHEILQTLDQFPITPAQLCKLSQTFCRPFSDPHCVRRRLRKLAAADLVRANPYAVASFGSSPAYYKLTRAGYRTLYGPSAELPSRRYFEPIGQARHPHTIALVDFLVHLFVQTDKAGHGIRHFARENSVSLKSSSGILRPDAAFQILAGQRAFNFMIELDNGSERVRSLKEIESIQRKIRGYDSHSQAMKAFDPSRYVVLFVTTRPGDRLKHIMAATDALMTNRQRTLFLGTTLSDFLGRTDVLTGPAFLTPQLKSVSLLPSPAGDRIHRSKFQQNLMPPLPAFC